MSRFGGEFFDGTDVDEKIEDLVRDADLDGIPKVEDIGDLMENSDAPWVLEELRSVLAFRDEVGDVTDLIIRDDYFPEYALELARDMGAISDSTEWPAMYIDWDKAADDLKQDYSSVEYEGTTYWYR